MVSFLPTCVRNRRMKTPSVIIIGAGPGGLATALLLAKAGVKVTVLERLGVVGGRCSLLQIGHFKFDRGPTFLHYPAALRAIFQAVGLNLEEELQLIRLDPMYRIYLGEKGHLDATADIEKMKAQIEKLSPRDVAGFERFIKDNQRKFPRVVRCLRRPFDRLIHLLSPEALGLATVLRPHKTLTEDLAKFFSDHDLRMAFTFQAKCVGLSPHRCPSIFSVLTYLEYAYGVFHPLGGCNAIPRRLAELAQRFGAKIHLREEVQEVFFEGRRPIGVRTQNDAYPCDALVINADFARAMQRLIPERLRKRWSNDQLAKKRYSCSTFMLYLGLEGEVDELLHHNIYLPPTYEEFLKDVEERHVLSEEPAFYVQNACRTDRTLAPPGHSTLYVLVPVTHQHPNVDWSKHRLRFREQILDNLQRIGLKDIRSRIRAELIWTPADWESWEIFRGATFNLAHNFGQMLYLRPHNRFEELEKVYLVGGGTHPGSGLATIFESARISARLLLEDHGYPTAWLRPGPLESPLLSVR